MHVQNALSSVAHVSIEFCERDDDETLCVCVCMRLCVGVCIVDESFIVDECVCVSVDESMFATRH
jgi:hypothetical protein